MITDLDTAIILSQSNFVPLTSVDLTRIQIEPTIGEFKNHMK